MKKLYSYFASALLVLLFANSFAQTNDTIVVQAFTYNTSRDSVIAFPSDTIQFEKILMRYKLRCPYTVQCGEWDYLSYTYAYEPTGKMDSVKHIAPSYTINGASPDSLPYSNFPTYNYSTRFDKHIVYDSVISFDSTIVGNGITASSAPFNAAYATNRSQYIWKASELTAAGLSAGNISGMRFYLSSIYGDLNKLIIKLKHTSFDSLSTGQFETTGLTTVYQRNTSFTAAGWQTLSFTNAFNWNGTSNIVVDISFDNSGSAVSYDVNSDVTGFASGVTTASNDRSLFFKDIDYVTVPPAGFASIDSFITIGFWAYGNPDFQPQNQSAFHATDAAGNRVLNVHLPWSDATVYWDAGNSGTNTYDRISKATTIASQYEGQWNYWTFTKNCTTGRMRIYLNGIQYFMLAAKFKRMYGITKFMIGSNQNGASNYDGNIDEFTVWNTEVDSATIRKWMTRSIDATHPYYNNLVYYYKFDDSAKIAADASVNQYDATLYGLPQFMNYTSEGYNRNLQNTGVRPQVIFEQGTYTSHLDSTLVIDSVATGMTQVIAFNDTLQPTTPTDTLYIYPLTYSYTYDALGVKTDSLLSTPDSTLHLVNTVYYDAPYQVTNRYEIGRFITPYGNGLNLGNGFTWWYDVSDYRTILHDSLRIVSGNWQELHDLQFLFIKGTPPRTPVSIQNVWNGNFYMRAQDSIETKGLKAKDVLMDPNAATYKFKMRPSGHGADNQNAAEFYQLDHMLKVDNTLQFTKPVWKDDCSINPLYPQGGTWVYQRANWCPGDEVPTFDFELTPFVNSGDTSLLDYDITPYISVGGSPANYVIESQVVGYGPINFALDAAVDQIKSPSKEDLFKRMNPICDNAVITIKNTGATVLNSLTITFGFVGGTPATYQWTGNLAFEQTIDVSLPGLIWDGTSNKFYATVSNPNGGVDMYAHNNSMESEFTTPPSYPNQVVFELKTNNQANQNSYVVKDAAGTVIHSRSFMSNNTTYSDTLNLANGCYTFILIDTLSANGIYGEDGLAWWANTAQGTGSMKIKNALTGALVKTFSNDFGREIYQQFTCGYLLNTTEQTAASAIQVYPNPTNGLVNFDLNFSTSNTVVINVIDATGKVIFKKQLKNVLDKNLQFDMSSYAPGIYHATIQFDNGLVNKMFVLQK